MARPLRKCEPNLTYHIYSRCIEKRFMIEDDSLKEMLIKIIIQTQKKYVFNLISYEIMDNHFHFIIQTVDGGATISRIMQYVKARFAERFNKLHQRTGPFWNERFSDIIINNASKPVQYLLWLLWYLAFNPVRAKKISNPRDYRYGCIRYYLDDNFIPPVTISYHEYFLALGSTFKEQVCAFLSYEESYIRRRLAFLF